MTVSTTKNTHTIAVNFEVFDSDLTKVRVVDAIIIER